MKVVHVGPAPVKEDFSLQGKIIESFLKCSRMLLFLVLSGVYNKTIHKNNIFLTAIMVASILTLIPSANAVFADDLHEKNVSINDKSINLSGEPSFSPVELLIKVKSSSKDLIKKSPGPDDTGIASLNALNRMHGASKFEQLANPGQNSRKDSQIFRWYKITFQVPEKTITKKSPGFGRFKQIMESYKSDSNIEVVEPDYTVSALLAPNDPYYSSSGSWSQSYPDLWGIRKINPEPAWDKTTGSASIVVASIDTGVDRNHEDIKDNMWVNTAEIPNNGIDDDGNGYVDDYYGWNWVSNTNDPMDDMGHGTHTVGTIAAAGNNSIGVVGVNWKSKIMALKFLDSSGSGSLSDGIKALQYAADMGAKVSSNSWGCFCNSVAMDDAIQYEHDKGMVVIAAAGNSNADALDFSPASSDGVITVAATNHNDVKASFSNWGEKIDVAAPGGDAASWGGIDDYILSLKAAVSPMCSSGTIGTNYCIARGTSMAAPHVAGLAALILSKNPNLTNEEVRQIIRGGAVDLGSPGKDIYYGYGRINASASVSLANTRPLAPYITGPRSRSTVYGTAFKFNGSITGPNFASYKLEAGAGRTPSTWTTIATSTTQVMNGTLATVDTTKLADGTYIFRITATDTNGKIYQFQVNDITLDNFDVWITLPFSLVPFGSADIIGTAQTKNGLPFANYTVEWGVGSVPTSWSKQGITLVSNGTQPINNGKLANWNTSGLADGQTYTLRLTVTSTLGASSQSLVTVKADKDLVMGWPKIFTNNSYAPEVTTPVIADLNGDGNKEVVMTDMDNKIYVYRKDGTDFPGFPFSGAVGDIFYTNKLNVVDLDNDGKKEIVASAYSNTAPFGKIYIVRSNGTIYPGWPIPMNWGQGFDDRTPTVADLNRDGEKELVYIDLQILADRTDATLHALRLNGTELSGFPKNLILPHSSLYPSASEIYYTYYGSLSIADLDNDGKPEIAWSYSNRVYLFNSTGDVLPGWPFIAANYNNKTMLFGSAVASGDVDGDGNLELFAIAYGVTPGSITYAGPETQLYGWRKDGSVLLGWPKTDQTDGIKIASLEAFNTPSLADIDNDGKDEVIVGLSNLTIFDFEGKKNLANVQYMNMQPALSDVDGDGRLEFGGGDGYNTMRVVKENDSTYSVYWQRILQDVYLGAPPALADLDNNGKMELATVTRILSSSDGNFNLVAYLWELPNAGANQARYEWPMFSHDPQRTGRLVLSANTTDTTPPTTSITSPSSGSTVSGIINVTVSASDNVGVTKVELYRNGTLVGTTTSSPFTFVWNTTQIADGIYTLKSKAYDAANNSGVSPLVTITVSNVPNQLATITVSPSSDTLLLGQNQQFTATGKDAAGNPVSITPAWSSSSGSINSSGLFTAQAVGTAIITATVVSVNGTATVAVISDNTPPVVSITSPLNNSVVVRRSNVIITANASDKIGVTKVEFYINGALQCTDTTQSYTCNWNVPAKPGATYSLLAKAYDSNNMGQSAIVYVTSK
jgi:subtilisin family serine protease